VGQWKGVTKTDRKVQNFADAAKIPKGRYSSLSLLLATSRYSEYLEKGTL
jgi:hypothetical protein